eukprot:TRINITY_DN20531_c0_g1_i1.p1 TRINITY_DN20531_c0_g1~~TRINITY_DN20531_c0_g1_i1.p1  ORF type:complete len:299 (-),score=107.12 TRINITY_DN20531_c0_g1_i1:309-1205(-)
MGKFSVRAVVAIGSSVSIWLAALLQALQAFGATGRSGSPSPAQEDFRKLSELDFDTLSLYWKWRRSQVGVDIVIDLFIAAGLLGLAYVTLILGRVFRRFKGGETDLPKFMTACFFIGSILPSIQFLQAVGLTTMSANISAWPSLNNATNPFPLQSLHVTTNLVRNASLYLFSLQFVFISVGLILAASMTLQTNELPKRHAHLGAVTGAIGLLVFILEVLTYNAGRDGIVAASAGIALGVFLLAWGVFLMPAWTIWLGVELKRMKAADDSDGTGMSGSPHGSRGVGGRVELVDQQVEDM